MRNLSEETGRLKSKATEAIARADREETARRAAESQVVQLRMQAETARSMEGTVQQQIATLQQQLQDANQVIESVRAERTKTQVGGMCVCVCVCVCKCEHACK